MSTPLQKEVYDVGGTRRQVSNQLTRTDAVNLLNQLRLTVPGTLAQLEGGDSEYVNATPGTHGFPDPKGEWSHIKGVGGGVVCNRQLVLSDASIIEGVHFKGDANPLVLIKAKTTAVNNTVIFRSCMFERTNQPKAPVWAKVESGALVVFANCVFRGGKYPNTGGTIISNAGAATKVQLVGCISTTGLTYSTVTSSGQGNISA